MFSSNTFSRDFLHSHHTNFKHVSIPTDFFSNQQQQNSRLPRYRSAPSSFLDSNADNSSGDESDAFFSNLLERDLSPKSSDHQISSGVKREDGYDAGAGSVSVSVGIEHHENGNRSNLVRQSGSPAGFFNGFGLMGEAGNYRVLNLAKDTSLACNLSSSMDLSSSSSRSMPSIPETGNENAFSHDRLRNEAAFQQDSWNGTSFNCLKRNRDGDAQMFTNFSGLENQNGGARKKSSYLVSHFSLPKTSTEIAAVENFLQFQQETITPCQVRAKRGFATHPRSIAERMRRTRISKNMKKLQNLFPNMDKQTNTADMLDLAVDYIKELQIKMQVLNEARARCVCSGKLQQEEEGVKRRKD